MSGPHLVSTLTIFAAVRYALGRQSYIVGETADLIKRLWPDLDAGERLVIARDISERLGRAALHWPDETDPSVRTWRDVLAWIAAQPAAPFNAPPRLLGPADAPA